jgi:hypothetical protein
MKTSSMRPHRFWTDRLSEALDGALSPAEARALEDHLEGCAACGRVRDELEEVRRRGQALAASPPQTDLWTGIARELGVSRRASGGEDKVIPMPNASPMPPSGGPGKRPPWSFAQAPFRTAAAGVLLLVVGGVFGARVGGAPPPPGPETVAEAEPDAQLRQAAAESVEPSLFAELRTLEEALRVDLPRLDPETRAAILGNLETIDRAIRESVAALRSDPDSWYLRGHLGSALQRKVGYLESVTRLLES